MMYLIETCEPLGFDKHEEKLLSDKEKIWKGEICPILRPVVGIPSRNIQFDNQRRKSGLGSDAEEKKEGVEG